MRQINYPKGVAPLTSLADIKEECQSQEIFFIDQPDEEDLENTICVKIEYPQRATGQIEYLPCYSRWILNELLQKGDERILKETEEYILAWIDELNNEDYPARDIHEAWGITSHDYTQLKTNADMRHYNYFSHTLNVAYDTDFDSEGYYDEWNAEHEGIVFRINHCCETFFTLKELSHPFYELDYISVNIISDEKAMKQVLDFIIHSNLSEYQRLWVQKPYSLPGFKDVFILGYFDRNRKSISISQDIPSQNKDVLLLHNGEIQGLSIIKRAAIDKGAELSISDFLYTSGYRALGSCIENMRLKETVALADSFEYGITTVKNMQWEKLHNTFNSTIKKGLSKNDFIIQPVATMPDDKDENLFKSISKHYVLKTKKEIGLLYKDEYSWFWRSWTGDMQEFTLCNPLFISLLNNEYMLQQIKNKMLNDLAYSEIME